MLLCVGVSAVGLSLVGFFEGVSKCSADDGQRANATHQPAGASTTPTTATARHGGSTHSVEWLLCRGDSD
jgi:hypothetical protein